MLQLLLKQIHLDEASIQSALEKKDLKKLYDANHKMLGGLLYCENVSELIVASKLLQAQFNTDNPDIKKIIAAAEAVLNEIKIVETSIENDTQQPYSLALPDVLHSKT